MTTNNRTNGKITTHSNNKSLATWRFFDKRVSKRQDPAKDQALIWRLSRAITASLRNDRQRQAEEAGAEVEALLGSDLPLHREAWHWIKRWYRAAVDCAPSPTWVTLNWITAERVELYSYVPPPGRISPFPWSCSRGTTWYLRRTISSGQ